MRRCASSMPRSRIDLLFTDMIMPGELNGKELAMKARAKRADLKVLFTSGFLGPVQQSTAHSSSAGDVLLSKPYHKRDLAKAVEQALQHAGVSAPRGLKIHTAGAEARSQAPA